MGVWLNAKSLSSFFVSLKGFPKACATLANANTFSGSKISFTDLGDLILIWRVFRRGRVIRDSQKKILHHSLTSHLEQGKTINQCAFASAGR